MSTLLENSGRGAILSECGRYRYRLWRTWDALLPAMVWVMLNPSTADADTDDPTLRKCMGFAKRHGHGGVVIVNLFAWRSTNPKELPRVADPIGPMNDAQIVEACYEETQLTIVAGWGADRFASARADAVKRIVRNEGLHLKCFGKSKHGQPLHPLYLSYCASMVNA